MITFTAHISTNRLVLYKGSQFPQEYDGNAFVAIVGPINQFPDAPERGVMRVVLNKKQRAL